MKPRKLRRLLGKAPLSYTDGVSKKGSHMWLESPSYPRLRWAFHDGEDISGGLVREILIKQVGLTEDEAK